MRQITTMGLLGLLADQIPPCVSLYQPTHRHHPDNRQDPIRYRNLLRQGEASLREIYPAKLVSALLAKLEPLAGDTHFWNQRTEGLAVLASAERFEVFEFQRPVKELMIVSDSFHIKPLLRILQSADRFQVLCLDREKASLYEGTRDVLDPVDLGDLPVTITESLGDEFTEPHQTVASYGLGPGAGGRAMHHGHGSRKDEVKIDADRFFRGIDRAILEHYSRPSGLPLMLAALPEHHAPFRAVSRNPHLMAEGLRVNPGALSLEALRVQAWQRIEPLYLERLNVLAESYRTATAARSGSDDLADVARAALAGRVGTLLVEADREIPGRLDPKSGSIEPGDIAHPTIEDVLDDLAETVLRMKGEVVVVPAERMPSVTGVAATYRF